MSFLSTYGGTILISAILLGIVALIVIHMVRKSRRGECVGCNCGSDGCSSKEGCGCHSTDDPK